MTTKMENALREEIEFMENCLGYAEDFCLEPIRTLDDAQTEVHGFVESVSPEEMPEALKDPATMLLVFNYCAEKEQEKRRKDRFMQKVSRESISVSDLMGAIERTVDIKSASPEAQFLILRVFEEATKHRAFFEIDENNQHTELDLAW